MACRTAMSGRDRTMTPDIARQAVDLGAGRPGAGIVVFGGNPAGRGLIEETVAYEVAQAGHDPFPHESPPTGSTGRGVPPVLRGTGSLSRCTTGSQATPAGCSGAAGSTRSGDREALLRHRPYAPIMMTVSRASSAPRASSTWAGIPVPDLLDGLCRRLGRGFAGGTGTAVPETRGVLPPEDWRKSSTCPRSRVRSVPL